MTPSFTDMATLINPSKFFKELRHERPVYFDENLNAYVISRYNDINDVFKQANLFSSALALFNAYNHENVVNHILRTKARGPFQSILPMTDPPEHTRIRQTLNLAFSIRRVAQFQQYIEGVIAELIDGFIDKGKIEVMSELAVPLPISVIAHLLSVPRERSADIKRWTQAYTACAGNRISSEEQAIQVGNDLAAMQNFIIKHIEERRHQQHDDILTDIVNARTSDGQQLSDDEILAVAAAFLVAGHETGSVVIVHLLKTLAENPTLMEYLRNADDKEKVYRSFIEEILRCHAPVRMLPRVTTDNAEVNGVAIPKGSLVFLIMDSGNKDETIFGKDAEQFMPDRINSNRHLSFGAGPHICIGNMLARTELKCLLAALVDRLDNIKLVNPTIPQSDYTPVVLAINVHPHKINISFEKRIATCVA